MPSGEGKKTGDSSENREITRSTRHYSEPGPIPQLPQRHIVLGPLLGGASDNDVIEHLDLEQLPGADQISRNLDVRFGGRRITAGMVMHQNESGGAGGNRRQED